VVPALLQVFAPNSSLYGCWKEPRWCQPCSKYSHQTHRCTGVGRSRSGASPAPSIRTKLIAVRVLEGAAVVPALLQVFAPNSSLYGCWKERAHLRLRRATVMPALLQVLSHESGGPGHDGCGHGGAPLQQHRRGQRAVRRREGSGGLSFSRSGFSSKAWFGI
jgi:hypothetical protein